MCLGLLGMVVMESFCQPGALKRCRTTLVLAQTDGSCSPTDFWRDPDWERLLWSESRVASGF